MKRTVSISAVLAASIFVAGFGGMEFAAASQGPAGQTASMENVAGESERRGYIVVFDEPGLMYYEGGVADLRATAPSSTGLKKVDVGTAASREYLAHLDAIQGERITAITSQLGRAADADTVYRYTITMSGLGLQLTADEAARIATMPGVKSVVRVRDQQLDTYRGPEFIGAGSIWDGSATPANVPTRGEGLTIGVIDSGANRDHPSFGVLPAECGDSAGETKLTAYTCMVGGTCSTTDTAVCSDTDNGPTPEDCTNHGSHTASTAAGNSLTIAGTVPAPAFDMSGVAPCAKIITYKVCATQTCSGTGIVAAIEKAIVDQVDVINFSISGGGGDDTSVWTVGATSDRYFLDALNADILVAASAGNTRLDPAQSNFNPTPESDVNHRGPWLTTVASSTHDEQESTVGGSIVVTGPDPVPAALDAPLLITTGTSPHDLADGQAFQLRHFGTAPTGCNADAAYPANFFDGDAALIARGACNFSEKVTKAAAAGASAVFVYNNVGGIAGGMAGLETATVPAYTIRLPAGEALVAFLATLDSEPAELSFNAPVVQGDVLSNFSLRGPITPVAAGAQGTGNAFDVTKPDITGPGDDIYAAYGDPANYGRLGGTSMSSPHVAGAYLLMRSVRPDWTATEIKSAIMLTAVVAGTQEDIVTDWTPDQVGNGRIDVSRAARSGLVMDETVANFIAADPGNGGDVRTLNLPSMRHSACTPNCTWTRTVESTLAVGATWNVAIENPPGFELTVTPSSFTLASAGATQVLTVVATPVPGSGSLAFGRIGLSTATAGQSPDLSLTVAVLGEGVGEDEIFPNGFECGEGFPGCDVTPTCEPLQLLADPSFETTDGDSGPNPSWVGEDSNGDGTPFWEAGSTTLSAAHEGDFVVWGGGWGSASTQNWSQSVTIPSGSPRFLNFWRQIEALPGSTGTLTASVDGTAVSTLDVVANGVDGDWVSVSVDVSAHADGAAHAIEFEYAGTGATDGNVYVDSITLECEAPTAAVAGSTPRPPAINAPNARKHP